MAKKEEYSSFLDIKTDWKIFLYSYLIINFAFLFDTFHFIWGNHDVLFVKERLYISSGLFEGRFTQFIPHFLLTHGQILPIINNLIGLLFLTLGLLLLVKYWRLPCNVAIFFIIFTATQPYTLSWLYFTFITMSCLLWSMLAILGLYIAEFISKSRHKVLLLLASCLCFYVVLGGYPPVINTVFVCFMGKLLFSYVFENKSLRELFSIHKYTLISIAIAILLFKVSLIIFVPDQVYNLQSTPIGDMPKKFLEVLKISYQQFIVALPFMEKWYKILLLIMVVVSFGSIVVCESGLNKRLVIMLFIFGAILAASLTTFLSVPHTEFMARTDFYGLGFVYALALALLLSFRIKFIQSVGVLFSVILVFFNIINDYRAQKVWKQGFDGEMQILEQVVERIEEHPNFNPNKRYRLRVLGDVSLRPIYYKQKFDKNNEPFLLKMPYLAMWQGGPLLEFYSPYSYLDAKNSLRVDDITSDVYDFLMYQAKPWPHKNSIWVDDRIVIVVYNQVSLEEFKREIKNIGRRM